MHKHVGNNIEFKNKYYEIKKHFKNIIYHFNNLWN